MYPLCCVCAVLFVFLCAAGAWCVVGWLLAVWLYGWSMRHQCRCRSLTTASRIVVCLVRFDLLSASLVASLTAHSSVYLAALSPLWLSVPVAGRSEARSSDSLTGAPLLSLLLLFCTVSLFLWVVCGCDVEEYGVRDGLLCVRHGSCARVSLFF